MFDLGPVIGLKVHQQAMSYFRRILWCPLPPGILMYDEIENRFSINSHLRENFCQILRFTIPDAGPRSLTSFRVFLPFPENFLSDLPSSYHAGFLIPFSQKEIDLNLSNDFFYLIGKVPRLYAPEDLHRLLFYDFNPHY